MRGLGLRSIVDVAARDSGDTRAGGIGEGRHDELDGCRHLGRPEEEVGEGVGASLVDRAPGSARTYS